MMESLQCIVKLTLSETTLEFACKVLVAVHVILQLAVSIRIPVYDVCNNQLILQNFVHMVD